MTFDFNSLITGLLTGSTVTLIVKWIVDQINKKIEFNRELHKITYVKKLEKAEQAVAYYLTYISRVLEIKKSLETILRAVNNIDEIDADIEIIQTTLNQNSKLLLDLTDTKFIDINAIHLYFDLEDATEWSEKDIGDLYESLSQTKFLDNNIQFWGSAYNSHIEKGDDEQAEYCWKQIKEILPNYIISLQRFIDVIGKDHRASYSLVQKIKRQLKKY